MDGTAVSHTDTIKSLLNLLIAGKFQLAGRPKNESAIDITNEDIRRLQLSLNEHGVVYLLVGGFAVNMHGYPRTTNDLDLWIKEDEENTEKLIKALKDNNIPGAEYLKDDKLVPRFTELTFGKKNFKIDLMHFLKAFSEMDFDAVYERSELSEFEGVPFRHIHKVDLITEKKAAGHHKDLDDLEHLES